MQKVEEISKKGTNAVRNLRSQKLEAGLPFYFSLPNLDADKGYLEYPDGRIHFVQLLISSREFKELRELTVAETQKFRQLLNVYTR